MDVLKRITDLSEERSWNHYRLSVKSGIPMSDISIWYSRNSTPSISTIAKLCIGFDISISNFFAENPDNTVSNLTPLQFELADKTTKLTTEQRIRLNTLVSSFVKTKTAESLNNISKPQNPDEN